MSKLLLLAIILSTYLSAEVKVLAFSGSTRADSYNQQLANEAAEIARKMGATVTVIELKNYPMPFYDADLEKSEGMPLNAKRFRNLLVENDAIIIASPEYNHSISAVLKNALDWSSRSEDGKPSFEAFKGKKFALMSASPGKSGGKRGLVHLKDIIDDVHGVVVPTQALIPYAHQYFSDKARPENPLLKEEILELLQPSPLN